jgi:hypothetical protein
MTNDRPLLARLNWYWIFQVAGWGSVPLFMISNALGYNFSWHFVAICCWGGVFGLLLSDQWHRPETPQRAGPRLGWKHAAGDTAAGGGAEQPQVYGLS